MECGHLFTRKIAACCITSILKTKIAIEILIPNKKKNAMFSIFQFKRSPDALLLLILASLMSICSAASKAQVSFVNFSSDVVILYWQDVKDETNLVEVGAITPYAHLTVSTFLDHSFAYEIDGVQASVSVSKDDSTFAIGPSEFQVECSTSAGDIHAHIIPKWSPFGASRFLELVDIGYFDGSALNRVVPNFLTQFGISANYAQRTKWRMANIPDDEPLGIKFRPGYMSYAGSGKDSRSTEMFIVMPNTDEEQLSYFGQNSWETPFGYVDMEDVEEVVGKWFAYGDMPPWGEGPDSQLIYLENGYDYLKEKFPNLSYLQSCKIVGFSFESDEKEEL